MSDTASGARIAAQLAFYFSDANLRHSRHMQLLLRGGKPGGDFDARRWVSLDHVASFRRVQALAPDAPTRRATVAAALRGSAALEVSADGARVRRRAAFSLAARARADAAGAVEARTCYFEPLRAVWPRAGDGEPGADGAGAAGHEDDDSGAAHDAVRALFSRCGRVLLVRLPREPAADASRGGGDAAAPAFCGFGFVEFAARASAARAIDELDAGPPAPAPAADGDAPPPAAGAGADRPPLRVITAREWRLLRDRWRELLEAEPAPRAGRGRGRGRGAAEAGGSGRGAHSARDHAAASGLGESELISEKYR